MAATTVRNWTCDRCNNGESTHADRQPNYWTAVIRLRVPMESADEGNRFHLCGSCTSDLALWLDRPSTYMVGRKAEWTSSGNAPDLSDS